MSISEMGVSSKGGKAIAINGSYKITIENSSIGDSVARSERENTIHHLTFLELINNPISSLKWDSALFHPNSPLEK